MVSGLIVSMAVLAAGQPQGIGRSGAEASQGAALANEYLALRASTPETADGHWKLGLWCEKKGLKAEALIEFGAVSELDPRRESAWKKLGYVKHEVRWLTPAQLAAIKAETDAQRKADG